MKKIALLALLASTAFTPAIAADLGRPVYKAPVAVAAPAYMMWNGFYIGGNVGYGWGRDRVDGVRADIDGFTGGGQIGYNWQFAPNWVFGIETDLQGSNIESNVALNTNTHLWGTVRGRVGYAFNNVLLYGTGGFAYGRTELHDGIFSQTKMHTGHTWGGGLEYAFAPNWSAKVEYLYVNLGREYYDVFDSNARAAFHTVRFGVNYRFGGAPIVASY